MNTVCLIICVLKYYFYVFLLFIYIFLLVKIILAGSHAFLSFSMIDTYHLLLLFSSLSHIWVIYVYSNNKHLILLYSYSTYSLSRLLVITLYFSTMCWLISYTFHSKTDIILRDILLFLLNFCFHSFNL